MKLYLIAFGLTILGFILGLFVAMMCSESHHEDEIDRDILKSLDAAGRGEAGHGQARQG